MKINTRLLYKDNEENSASNDVQCGIFFDYTVGEMEIVIKPLTFI
jgi:hypothetical protein